jgi:ribose/xylose/arabinose/galactoside ABC-type transport system permease subunit
MKGLGLAISMSGMVACGMLFCLASGDFDLSVASVIACAGVTTAVVINMTESLWIGVFAGLLLGVLSGLVNGFVIARLKINALITTLATMQIVRGLAYIISDGKAVGIEDERFFTLGYANWLGLPAPIWLTVACLILFGFLLNRTTFGRNTLAIGGNEEAARLAGVPVVRTKIIIFVLSGLVSAAAGIILASRMTSGQPMTSIGYELIVISACVLGGIPERRHRKNLICGGRYSDSGDGRKRHEPAEHLSVLAVCGTRPDPAGSGDLRPLQAKSEAYRLSHFPPFTTQLITVVDPLTHRPVSQAGGFLNGEQRHTVYTYMANDGVTVLPHTTL